MDNENQAQQGQQEQQGTNAAQFDISAFVEEMKAENAALRESVELLRKAIQASNRSQGGAGGTVTAEAALKKFFN